MRIFRKTIPSKITKKAVELVAPYASGPDRLAYIFCDSKSTLSYESEIAEKFGGSFSIEVTSFSRYVLKESGAFDYLSKSAAALVIADILSKRKGELTRLKRSNYSVSAGVYELIEQLKASKISPEDLGEIVEKENGALSNKLKDIRLVYSDYENYLKEHGLSDDGTVLSMMPELLKKDEAIKGAKVVVAGISNFTKQSMDIVVALERLCDLDCVILSYDGDGAVNESYYKLLSVFHNAEVFDDDCVYPRAVEILKNRLFSPEKFSEKGEYRSEVTVVEAADALDEVGFVAETIALAVKNEGRRFKDFAVACPDVETFAPIFKKAFDDHALALYADVKMPLVSHPKVALFSALCELKKKNCRVDSAVALTKCALAFCDEEKRAFEDYVLKNAVRRYGIRKEFNETAAESVRMTVVSCCDKLLDNGLIGQHIAAFKAVFEFLGVPKRAKEATERLKGYGEDILADFSVKGGEAFDGILSESESLLSGRKIGIAEFCDLVLSSAAACEISLLPKYNDCVFLGDYRSTRIRTAKILFCTGLTVDTPFYKSDNALLCDRELIRMERFKVVVEPKISIVNKREKECVATTLASFSERLYATYPLLSASGEKTKRGQVVDYIVNAFSDGERSPFISLGAKKLYREKQSKNDYIAKGAGLKKYFSALENFRNETVDDLTAASSFLEALKRVDPALYARATREEDVRDVKEELSYGGALSASLIETYFSCPYSAFGKKILKLKEADSGEIEAWEFGNMIHAVLEEFAKICDGLSADEVAPTAKRTVEEVLKREEFSRYKDKNRYAYALGATKAEAIKECARVYELQKRSAFKVLGTELRFGDEADAGLPAIRISTPAGERKISGFIDRLDVLDRPDGKKYARVIDYKTGSAVDAKAELKKLYSGKNVQLYLYMNAALGGGYLPAGVHYFAANDDYINAKTCRRSFYGAMVGSEEIISAMDERLVGEERSDDYGVNGTVNGKDVFDEATFLKLIEYSKKVTASGASEMAKGCFSASPTESACDYCGLRGACRFDEDDPSSFREEIPADGEKIVKAVEDCDE